MISFLFRKDCGINISDNFGKRILAKAKYDVVKRN